MNCSIILLPINKWNGNEEKGRQKSKERHRTPSLHDLCAGSDVGGRGKEGLRRQGKSRDHRFDRRTIISSMGRIGRERYERSVSIQELTRTRGVG